jgi:hypothetical protein
MKKLLRSRKLVIYITLLILLITNTNVNAASTGEKITGEEYLILLVKALKLTVDKTDDDPYVDAAISNKLIKEEDLSKLSAKLTREYAAYLTNQADIILSDNKYSYDEYLYYQIKSKKRISDISKCNKSYRVAIYKIFSKGIMVGDSNGTYSQNRSFGGKKTITLKEANTIIKRLTNISSRKKISFDGQVIRTTNLPKNYKKYEYILESFPNYFYEMKFDWEFVKTDQKKIDGKTYFSPAKIKEQTFWSYGGSWSMEYVMNKYLDKWVEKVYTNVYTRLNADYKTINQDSKWLNKLRNTYFLFDNAQNDYRQTKQIKEYIKEMMKNKVVVKSSKIVVEPSTFYESITHETFLRVYAKYKITATNINVNQNNLIFGDYIWIKNLNKDKWIEGVYDISIGTSNLASNGADYAVFRDDLNDFDLKGK